MKLALFIALCLIAVTATIVAAALTQPTKQPEMGQGGGRVVPFQRFGPDEFGVVCYIAPAPPPAPSNVSGLSCLKIK